MLVERDDLVAQLIVRGMQRHGERHRQVLVGQLPHPGHHADSRYRESACADAQAVRVGGMDLADGRQHRLVVGHRLAHAHEYDIVDVSGPARQFACREPPGRVMHLPDDLGCRQVALQAALTGGTEGAGHSAAGLRGDADRGAVAVPHDHRLDDRVIECAPRSLDRGAMICGLLPHRGQHRREPGLVNLLAEPGRQIGPARRVGVQPGEPLIRDLLGAKCRQPGRAHRLDALFGGQIHPMHRWLAGIRDEPSGEIDGSGGSSHMDESAARRQSRTIPPVPDGNKG